MLSTELTTKSAQEFLVRRSLTLTTPLVVLVTFCSTILRASVARAV
jgi:hypothetical protein